VETEAGKYGLRLNRSKTRRLAYGSERPVHYSDGTPVVRVEQIEYLGSIIHENGDPGPELRHRMEKALNACAGLRPIWRCGSLERKLAVRVLTQCVFAALLYGLHALFYNRTWEKRVNALQVRCLRRAMRIPTTYAAKRFGGEAIPNREVARLQAHWGRDNGGPIQVVRPRVAQIWGDPRACGQL